MVYFNNMHHIQYNLECVSALYSTPYVWYRMPGWLRHIQCIVKYGSWLCAKDAKQLHALWRSRSLANVHVESKCSVHIACMCTNVSIAYIARNTNLVETHCYSIGRAGQLLSNHVAVETDWSWDVKRFQRKGLRQLQHSIVTDEDLRGQNVLHFSRTVEVLDFL